MADLTTIIPQLIGAIPQLKQVPQCAVPAYAVIAGKGCGPKLDCICGNKNFFLTLQGVLIQGTCTPVEAAEALSSTRDICTKALPWLNDNRGPEIVAAITIMIILSTIAVIMRCMARRVTNQRLGWDDWLIIGALFWSYGLTIVQYSAVHYGMGRHILLLNLDQITHFTKLFFAGTVMFPPSMTALKISVLFFYHRIFPMRSFRNISIVLGLITILWFIGWEIALFLQCIPLAFYWDKTIPGGHCINAVHISNYGFTPVDIAVNFAIIVLPIPWLWDLQMPRSKKVAITVIFILGSFAAIGSIVRIPFLDQLKETDISYSIVNSAIWLNVESNIGILSASLPCLRPLFSKTFPNTFKSKYSSSKRSKSTVLYNYNGKNSYGSQRLPDVEKPTHCSHGTNTTGGRSSTLRGESNAGLYVGNNGIGGGNGLGNNGGKGGGHKHWFNGVSSIAMSTNKGEEGSEGSEEDMVPMGRIGVRHEVDWEERERGGERTPEAV